MQADVAHELLDQDVSAVLGEIYIQEDRALAALPVLKRSLSRADLDVLKQEQQDELEALAAIYGEDMLLIQPNLLKLRVRPLDLGAAKALWLTFYLPEEYPVLPPIFELEHNGNLSHAKEEELYTLLLDIASSTDKAMIYDLTQEAVRFWAQEAERIARRQEEARTRVYTRRHAEKCTVPTAPPQSSTDVITTEDTTEQELIETPMPLQLYWDEKERHPFEFIGPLAAVLQHMIARGIGILRVENIMRQDLAFRFHQQWELFASTFGDECQEGIPMGQPVLTFHGTADSRLSSIVTNGLVVPGGNVSHRTDSGYYGKGIYVSPDPRLSLGYSGDQTRVLVCAVLMGRHHVCQNVEMGRGRAAGYHSHMSSDRSEYVLFSSSQVLPCFLVSCVQAMPKVGYEGIHVLKSGLCVIGEMQHKEHMLKEIVARGDDLCPSHIFFGGQRHEVLERAPNDDDDDDDCMVVNPSDFQQDVLQEQGEYYNERYCSPTLEVDKPLRDYASDSKREKKKSARKKAKK